MKHGDFGLSLKIKGIGNVRRATGSRRCMKSLGGKLFNENPLVESACVYDEHGDGEHLYLVKDPLTGKLIKRIVDGVQLYPVVQPKLKVCFVIFEGSEGSYVYRCTFV